MYIFFEIESIPGTIAFKNALASHSHGFKRR